MKTLEEKIKIMSAALAGAKIEYRDGKCWCGIDIPDFNWSDFDYRVKPEPEQIPFDFSDALILIERKCKHKTINEVAITLAIKSDGVVINNKFYTFAAFSECYEILSLDSKTWEPCTKIVK